MSRGRPLLPLKILMIYEGLYSTSLSLCHSEVFQDTRGFRKVNFKLLIRILLTCFVSFKGHIFYWTPKGNIIKLPNILPPYIPNCFRKLPRSNQGLQWMNKPKTPSINKNWKRSLEIETRLKNFDFRIFDRCPSKQPVRCSRSAQEIR